jgi:uncharacterized protein (UPF0335 family)
MTIFEEADEVNGVNKRIISYVERIERLKSEIDNLNADVREIFAEIKSSGHSAKAIREVIKLRKMNPADREEQDYLVETYRKALDI